MSFDAVVLDEGDNVLEIQVKRADASSRWIWGAFKMPGRVLHDLHALWQERRCSDEYIGTLVNAYLAAGGRAVGVKAGHSYVDVGTLGGYRSAITLLSGGPSGDSEIASGARVGLGRPGGHTSSEAEIIPNLRARE
jgi:glucose-1-phosphate thymidylyltransferase